MKEGFGKKIKGISAAIALASMSHSDSPEKPATHSYSERTVAAKELEEKGITNFQRTAYKPGISESLEKNIMPYSYSGAGTGSLLEDIERIATDMESPVEARDKKRVEDLQRIGKMSHEHALGMVQSRRDAWRLYLGLPQEHGTFGISDFKPEHGHDDIYYYKLEHFLDRFAEYGEWYGKTTIQRLVETADNANGKPVQIIDYYSGVMGTFTLTKGKDEHGSYVSYYDRWNLEGSTEGGAGVVGKPFEIYDRIYYDPKLISNYEVNQHGGQDATKAKREDK